MQSALGVAHRRRWVVVQGPKVAVAVHQRRPDTQSSQLWLLVKQ
jgi:hypothetical protein